MNNWQTQSRGNFDFDDMCNEIKKFILTDSSAKYEISVGTDSQQHSKFFKFVTSIVIYRVSKGAQYYYHVEHNNHIDSLQQKIMYEAVMTYKYKVTLKDALEDLLIEHNIVIKPHVDIGTYGATKKFVNQIIGMLRVLDRVRKL